MAGHGRRVILHASSDPKQADESRMANALKYGLLRKREPGQHRTHVRALTEQSAGAFLCYDVLAERGCCDPWADVGEPLRNRGTTELP